MIYRQCVLKKDNENYTVSWIPDKYAKRGKYLKLLENGKWDNGWKVMAVYDKATSSEVDRDSRKYLKQRAASDI